MRVPIPDDVVALYEPYADAQGKPVEDIIATQLRRFAKLPPGKKALVLPADLTDRLEGALGGLPFRDAADLLARIEAHAQIRFAGVNIPLTPAQKAELVHRAERQGKTVQQLVEDTAAIITRDLFWTVAGPNLGVPLPTAAFGQVETTPDPAASHDSPLDALQQAG